MTTRKIKPKQDISHRRGEFLEDLLKRIQKKSVPISNSERKDSNRIARRFSDFVQRVTGFSSGVMGLVWEYGYEHWNNLIPCMLFEEPINKQASSSCDFIIHLLHNNKKEHRIDEDFDKQLLRSLLHEGSQTSFKLFVNLNFRNWHTPDALFCKCATYREKSDPKFVPSFWEQYWYEESVATCYVNGLHKRLATQDFSDQLYEREIEILTRIAEEVCHFANMDPTCLIENNELYLVSVLEQKLIPRRIITGVMKNLGLSIEDVEKFVYEKSGVR